MKQKIINLLNRYMNGDEEDEENYEENYLSDLDCAGILTGEGISLKHKTDGRSDDNSWIILSVTDLETQEESYWKIPGYYSSYDGGTYELNNVHKVKPVEKTIIVWKRAE
jgi:hypothetical protein